ncbi:MAG: hypothetical protein ACD_40C00211G0003 [uncultured bacterium]|nr:MAG: hypothetical protein ACD_40C00211G0003 [uncultured bacterium]
MAITQTRINQFTFLKLYGVNQNTIDYLIGELDKIRVPAASATIPLPAGDGLQSLPVTDALDIIADWGEAHNFLYEADLAFLRNNNIPLKKRLNRVSNAFKLRIKDSNKLVTASRIELVEKYRTDKLLNHIPATDKFDPLKAIKNYNDALLHFRSYLQHSRSQGILAQLVPDDLVKIDPRLIRREVEDFILDNLSELRTAAATAPNDPTLQAARVAQKFDELLHSTRPDLSTLSISFGDPKISLRLHALVTDVVSANQVSLLELADRKNNAALAMDLLLPSKSQLASAISSRLTISMDDTDKQKLAQTILRQLVKDSYSTTPISATTLISNAAKSLNLSDATTQQLITELENTPIALALEHRFAETRANLLELRLNPLERQLLALGIDLTTPTDPTVHQQSVAQFIQTYNQARTDVPPATSLSDIVSFESSSPTPHLDHLRHANHLLDQDFLVSLTTNADRRLINTSQIGRKLSAWSDKVREKEARFYDKWFEFEENLPWNKASRKVFAWYDKLAEKTILKIKIGGKEHKIPLLNLTGWAFDTWHNFKEGWVKRQLINLRGTKSILGKFSQTIFRNYAKGDYTIGGMFYSWTRETVGRSLNWLAQKAGYATAKKFGQTALGKAAELGNKLLVKLGGQALLKLGVGATTKLIGALVGLASGIGSILGIVAAALFVVDILKAGFQFVREFIRNVDFRKQVLKIGAVLAGIGAAFAALPLGAMLAIIIGSLVSLALLAFVISGGFLVGTALLYHLSIQTIPGLDSKATQIFTSIVCNSSSASGGSPTATCASCLVKYLSECYGQEVTDSDFTTTGIGCLIAKTIAPDVAEIIEQSATSFTYLQCVGFVQASIACGGGSLAGNNACGYIGSSPAGWKYVAGTSGAKSGNPCMIASSGTCSDGAPGHIFIVGEENCGDVLCAIDANQVCSGCVSADSRIPISQVAGCLVPN